MKRKIFFPFFLSVTFFCSAQNNDQGFNDMINLKRYEKENVELMKSSAKTTNRVVFIGNSITERWVKIHPDFFISNNYVGRGISGQTSSQVLLRFRNDVINLKPAAVVINVGTNDIAENTGVYNADFTFNNIKSMAEIANANRIKVILSSITPASRYYWRITVENVVEKIADLNKRIEFFAKENNYEYIDYFSKLTDIDGALPYDYGRDGVHPNAEAYEIMEITAKKVIQKVLK